MKRLLKFLSPILCAALVAGCGGGSVISSSPGPAHGSKTFDYTGAAQTYEVPSGVTRLTISAYGASGGGGSHRLPRGGLGAVVKAVFAVRPRQRLKIFVGGDGEKGPGFNGGGAGTTNGGGSSDVRNANGGLNDRIIVAGAGGGSGYSYKAMGSSYSYYWCRGGGGGDGGAKIGGAGGRGQCTGAPEGGAGGKQTSGGAGGAGGIGYRSRGGSRCKGNKGTKGQLLDGGNGGIGCAGPGGGGGGGYYGGGGGGSGGCCSDVGAGGSGGGGGGGSSFVDKSATQISRTTGEAPRGNGQIVITW